MLNPTAGNKLDADIGKAGNFHRLSVAAVVPITATTTNTTLPVITSVQLNLPSVGQITITCMGFGSGRPTVTI